MAKKRFLVTSALPYVNNVPHLGTLVCIISADVYTRYLRSKGYEVISVLGTDEHGTTTEFKAKEEGLTPREICDKFFELHKKIYDFFLCSFDCFGRTSDKETHEVTKDIFEKLYKSGFIEEGTLTQLYCDNCKMFLPDRFVIGTCPHCGYDKARGDQCEACGNLLNPDELIDPKCAFCGTTPRTVESKHLFLSLDKLQSEIEEFVKEREDNWTLNAKTMTWNWLKKGLQKRCITRDLSWGIKVPLKGYENKVFYSWFDAPIGYIGITKQNRKDWKEWWFNDKEVSLVQFMGKDNIPFHTILFPSYLIGTRDNYTLLDKLSVNEYLNYEDLKFSKSLGIGVFGDDVMNLGFRPDVWRYYLMINRPEKTDTVFSWDDFAAKLNNELVANLGNLVYRVISFVNRFYNSTIPEANEEDYYSIITKERIDEIKKLYESIDKSLEKISLKDALKQIMLVSKVGNQIFQENEPWKLRKQDKKTVDIVISFLVNLVKDLAILVEPYMPGVSKDIFEMLNIQQLKWDSLGNFNQIKAGHKIKPQRMLFKKVEDKMVEELKNKFSGKKEKISLENKEKSEENDFLKLNLRVAEIKSVEEHPNADKLYVLKIDLGNEERQLVAGLKKYYSKDELVGKHIVVVSNLQPAKLRGVESQGMLLAGENLETGKVKILEAPNSEPGSLVYIESTKGKEPNQNIIPFSHFEKIKLKVKDSRVYYKDEALRTDKEFVSVALDKGIVR